MHLQFGEYATIMYSIAGFKVPMSHAPKYNLSRRLTLAGLLTFFG